MGEEPLASHSGPGNSGHVQRAQVLLVGTFASCTSAQVPGPLKGIKREQEVSPAGMGVLLTVRTLGGCRAVLPHPTSVFPGVLQFLAGSGPLVCRSPRHLGSLLLLCGSLVLPGGLSRAPTASMGTVARLPRPVLLFFQRLPPGVLELWKLWVTQCLA